MVRVPLDRKGPRAFAPPLAGRVQLETLESSVLAGNPLGDPTSRTLACYAPPSGRSEGKPLLLLLSGFTGSGWMSFQRPAYLGGFVGGYGGEPQPQRLERLIREKKCGEATIVAPDCLTTLGGSQYVNSSATGNYEDHLVKEVVPWARERFRPSAIGVLGQSSGGFGALHLAFRHPDLFQAVGSSSGDMAFEYCYLPDFPKSVREFRKHGGPEGFLGRMLADPSLIKGPFDPTGAALNALAMSACYSPVAGAPGEFELPFDPGSGELLPQVWERWLKFDPVVRVGGEEGRAAAQRLKLIHITASAPDEWALDVGARIFVARAKKAGIPVVHEEFEGGHMSSGPRFEALYARLVQALG